MDEPPILLVAGLGNPGSKYTWTWHNMGFLVLDFWAESKGLIFKPGRGDYYQLFYQSEFGNITLLKPSSYMNLSGVPISAIARKRKLAAENVLIVCDDVALPLGTIRIRRAGSDGGHRGLASVIAEFESQQVPRMRLGIYSGDWQGDLRDYVLTKIPLTRRSEVKKVLQICSEAIDCILNQGITAAMNYYNRNFLATPTETD